MGRADHERSAEEASLLEELRVSEERLRMVVSNAPVVLWAFDRHGVFTLLDGSGLRALGPKARAVVGKSVFDVYHELPDVVENSRRVLCGEEFVAIQEIDGVVFETYFSPLRDRSGEMIGAMGVSIDISERRRAEQDLREREDRLSRIFHRSPAAIAINGRKNGGPYLDVNEEFLRLTGRTRAEVLGRTPAELDIRVEGDDDRNAVAEGLQMRGFVEDFEARIRAADGTLRFALFSATVIELNGEPCVLSFLHDVTRRKEAESALHAIADRLLQSREEERRRVTSDLHQATSELLATITANLTVVERSAESLEPAAREALAQSLEQLDRCAREVRTLSYVLSPPEPHEAGLVQAVRRYASGFSEQSGIRICVKGPNAPIHPSPETEATLLRVVQGTLANLHGRDGVCSAAIRIQSQPGQVRLEVRDRAGNGAGPGPVGAMVWDREASLTELRDRVRRLRGSLDVRKVPRGNAVTVVLPLLSATDRRAHA